MPPSTPLFDFNGIVVGRFKPWVQGSALIYAEELMAKGVPFGDAHTRATALPLISEWASEHGMVVSLTVSYTAKTDYKRVEARSRFLLEETLCSQNLRTKWIGISLYSAAPTTHFFLENGLELVDKFGSKDARTSRVWACDMTQTEGAFTLGRNR